MKNLTQGLMVLSALFSLTANIANYNKAIVPAEPQAAAIQTLPAVPKKQKPPVPDKPRTDPGNIDLIVSNARKENQRIVDKAIRENRQVMLRKDAIPAVTQIDRNTIPVPTMDIYPEVVPQVPPGVNPATEQFDKLPPLKEPLPAPTPIEVPVYTDIQTASAEQ